MDGVNIVGVQFRRAGRIYDFATGELNLHVGDDVVVDTDRGPSLAKVAVVRYRDRGDYKENGLKTILRNATVRDMEEANKLTPEYCVEFARKKVEELELKMSVLQAEVQFGGNKAIIFFTAPGRVDFRQLVKDLAGGLKSRVELKQVGARDEAKLVGGIGICGREFCCSSFLRDFVPVSIKMAKNQNLALNPTKVSGGCGRLLCCLTYENDTYTKLRKEIPKKGTLVRLLETGVEGKVLKGDVLNQRMLIDPGEGARWVEAYLKDLEIVDVKGTARPVAKKEGAKPVQKTPVTKASTETATSSAPVADDWGDDLDMAALTEKPATKPEEKNQKTETSETSVNAKNKNPDAQKASGADDKKKSGKNRNRSRNRNKNRNKKSSSDQGGDNNGNSSD
jgi:cell fate regulator YaaT (PSP1 superfamily)